MHDEMVYTRTRRSHGFRERQEQRDLLPSLPLPNRSRDGEGGKPRPSIMGPLLCAHQPSQCGVLRVSTFAAIARVAPRVPHSSVSNIVRGEWGMGHAALDLLHRTELRVLGTR